MPLMMKFFRSTTCRLAAKHPARYSLMESGERGRESFSGNPLPMW